MSTWEDIRSRVDPNAYGKGGKLGYKTRTTFGSALDNFPLDLEDLEDKKTAVYSAINQVENPEEKAKLEKSLTLSIASTYEKMKNAVLYERSLAPEPTVTVNSAFDAFLPEEDSAPEVEISSGFNEQSLNQALQMVERLKRSAQY